MEQKEKCGEADATSVARWWYGSRGENQYGENVQNQELMDYAYQSSMATSPEETQLDVQEKLDKEKEKVTEPVQSEAVNEAEAQANPDLVDEEILQKQFAIEASLKTAKETQKLSETVYYELPANDAVQPHIHPSIEQNQHFASDDIFGNPAEQDIQDDNGEVEISDEPLDGMTQADLGRSIYHDSAKVSLFESVHTNIARYELAYPEYFKTDSIQNTWEEDNRAYEGCLEVENLGSGEDDQVVNLGEHGLLSSIPPQQTDSGSRSNGGSEPELEVRREIFADLAIPDSQSTVLAGMSKEEMEQIRQAAKNGREAIRGRWQRNEER
jgi:hypothetical protein